VACSWLSPPNGTGLTLSTYAFTVVPGGKWTGGSGTVWHSPSNWSSAMTPGPDFTAVLDGPPAANQPVLSGDGSAKALVFTTAGWIIGTDASHTLNVGPGGISSAGSGINAIDPTVNFTGPAAVSVGSDNTLVLAAVTAGNNLLTKSGAGVLVLAGANVCGGGTVVSEGTLRVTNTTGSGTGTGPVTVGAATLGGTGFISGPVTLTGDSTLTSTGTLTINNILTVQGLANQIAGGTIWTTGDVTIDPGAVFIINGMLASETGVLHVRGTLMGKGTIGIPVSIEAGGVISPGSPSTIQTMAQVLNAEGAKHFSFEIGGPTPLYAKPVNSLNDVIRLTDAALPFANAAGDAPARLAPSSLIDVYFLFNDPPQGRYKAQFFAGTDFTDAIRDATFKYWLLDPRGTCLHNGNFFSLLDPSLVDWSVVPETADFAARNRHRLHHAVHRGAGARDAGASCRGQSAAAPPTVAGVSCSPFHARRTFQAGDAFVVRPNSGTIILNVLADDTDPDGGSPQDRSENQRSSRLGGHRRRRLGADLYTQQGLRGPRHLHVHHQRRPWRYSYGRGQHHRHYGQSIQISGAALVGRWLVDVGHRIGVRRRRCFPLPARTVSRRPPRPAPGQLLRVCTHPHDCRGRSEP